MVRFGGKRRPSPLMICFPQQEIAVTSKSPISRTRDTSVLTLIWFRNPANELRLVVYLITYLTFLFTSNRQKSLGVLVAIKSSVRSTVDRMTFLWSTGTGRALMFYSLHPNGRPNLSSMHGACKARDGKWRGGHGGGQVNCIRIAGILFLNQNSLICWWIF